MPTPRETFEHTLRHLTASARAYTAAHARFEAGESLAGHGNRLLEAQSTLANAAKDYIVAYLNSVPVFNPGLKPDGTP